MNFVNTRMSAVISLDGFYRHVLRRAWNDDLPFLVVCMLNPSTADAYKDDPTLRELIYFAKRWGYGGLIIVNLYDWRTSSPTELKKLGGPHSNVNIEHLNDALRYAASTRRPVLVAWGNDGGFQGKDKEFVQRAAFFRIPLICFGVTQSGAPKHPMSRGKHRIPRHQEPLTWRHQEMLA